MADTLTGDYTFTGECNFTGTMSVPNATVTNADISSAAAIDADKVENRVAITYRQKPGTDVVTETDYVHLCRAAGTVKSVEVRPLTAPTGGDKQFTVDVKKAINGSGTYSTLLNAVETVDNTSADDTRQQAVLIGTPSTADGDSIQVVVTASGSTGSQGDGVVVTINLDESGT